MKSDFNPYHEEQQALENISSYIYMNQIPDVMEEINHKYPILLKKNFMREK